jgi:hypothetical protein
MTPQQAGAYVYCDWFFVAKFVATEPSFNAADVEESNSLIKSVDGLARESIKSVNGLVIGSIKSINGLA